MSLRTLTVQRMTTVDDVTRLACSLLKVKTFATVVVLLAMLGCSKGHANRPPSAPVTADSSAPEDEDDATESLLTYHQFHHYGGITLIIAMSLQTLGVPEERRADIEQIKEFLQSQMEGARAAEERLINLLADGLDANQLDPATVDDAIAKVTEAAATVHEATEDALNHLHEVLTPEERAALADKVLAHFRVWQRANARNYNVVASTPDRVAELAANLNLTPEQVSEIHARLYQRQTSPIPEPKNVARYLSAFTEAFRRERFNAKALEGGHAANASLAGWGAMIVAQFVEAVRPVLTASQRTIFARILREHANHGHEGAGP